MVQAAHSHIADIHRRPAAYCLHALQYLDGCGIVFFIFGRHFAVQHPQKLRRDFAVGIQHAENALFPGHAHREDLERHPEVRSAEVVEPRALARGLEQACEVEGRAQPEPLGERAGAVGRLDRIQDPALKGRLMLTAELLNVVAIPVCVLAFGLLRRLRRKEKAAL